MIPDLSWKLSLNRTLAVYRFLLERGMAPDMLKIEAFGKYRPYYPQNSAENRAKTGESTSCSTSGALKRARKSGRCLRRFGRRTTVSVWTDSNSTCVRPRAGVAWRKRKSNLSASCALACHFSDLVTLLLTFFVLLLTMSSMDNAILTRVTLHTADLGLLDKRGSGRVTAKERLVVDLMAKPWQVLDKKQRIKDLLFPDDVLPEELDKSELDKNLEILPNPTAWPWSSPTSCCSSRGSLRSVRAVSSCSTRLSP